MAINQNTKQVNETLSIQDLVLLCISKWKWFVVSLVCFLGIAVIYLLTTPPVYTRSASILVKEDAKGSSSFSSELNSFADMGMFNANVNANNELTSMQSPALILEVIKRLHLDMDYRKDGTFYKEIVYGRTLPVSASVIGLADNDFCSFTLQLDKSGQIELSDFTLNGEDIVEGEEICKGALKDSIVTPIGKIVVEASPYYQEGEEIELYVTRLGVITSIENCLSKFSAIINNEKTTIIDISYQDVSIQRAEEFLNTLISVYNENWVKDKNQIAVSTSQFINDRLLVIEQELGNVDSDISSYKSEHLIPDVQAASNMYMTQANEANAQILNLSNQLYMARYIRNFVMNESNNYQLLPANSGINNTGIELQITEYNEKLLQRNSLVANSSTSNPIVVNMDSALVSMRKAIISSIDNQISALDTQIKGFRASEKENTARIASNPTQAKYLLSVGRQQKVKETLYLFLLQKREENELSQAFTAYNTRVITPPTGKLEPTAPIKKNVLLVALLAGILVPVVIIFVCENMNTKVRGRKDLEKLTVPFVGELPLYGKKKGKYGIKKTIPEDRYKILVKARNRNSINEAFRVIRTNVEFMLEQDGNSKIIMLSSVNPGSGKTFVSMNLAACFSIKERKTVVLDLDMRKASISNYVGNPKEGISNYLSGQVEDWKKMVVKEEGYPNLDIIPVGTIPPNPSELLFKPKLDMLLKTLREEYDLIVIDCPPVEMVADSAIIAKWADMTLFVIRAGLLEREMLPIVENYYIEKKFNNMSLLLNGTEISGRRGYHRYGYHYGYGYGYGDYAKEDE